MKPLTPVPSGPPFSVPDNVTYNGGPCPTQDASLFVPFASANELLAGYATAITKQGLTTSNLRITDGIASGSYSQFAPSAGNPPANNDVSVFLIQATLQDADLVTYDLNDVAGNLFKRVYFPDMAQGDSNYKQEGSGADAKNVAVAGVIVLGLLADSGVAQGHWEKA